MRKFTANLVLALTFVVSFMLHLSPAGMAAESVDKWLADVPARQLENPLNANRRSQRRGERTFDQRCTVCHGEGGAGDGPGGRALSPKPANLTSEMFQSQTDGEIFWKISEGRSAMPAWRAILDEEERWDLVNYLNSLPED